MNLSSVATLSSLVLTALASSMSGCGGIADEAIRASDGGVADPAMGAVSVQMQLPSGVFVAGGDYVLRGANGFARSGPITASSSGEITCGVAQVPASDSYSLALTTKSVNGSTECTSSAQFGVQAMRTTAVVLIPHCSGAAPMLGAPTSASVGTLEITVDLPTGVSIATLVSSIVGANGVAMEDSWSVAGDSAVLLVIKNVSPGQNESVSVRATSTDGQQACTGTGAFDIFQNETTHTTLVMRCASGMVAAPNH